MLFAFSALCRPGYYSDNSFHESFSPCEACPVGTYQPAEGQTTCVLCPDGSNTTFNGSTSVENCTGKLLIGRTRTTTLPPIHRLWANNLQTTGLQPTTAYKQLTHNLPTTCKQLTDKLLTSYKQLTDNLPTTYNN